jgi:hypothetical protein
VADAKKKVDEVKEDFENIAYHGMDTERVFFNDYIQEQYSNWRAPAVTYWPVPE